jgi:hypothetical protein
MSPWGGYGEPRELRVEYGIKQGKGSRICMREPFWLTLSATGFEVNDHGFSLGGRKYSERFYNVCADMILNNNVNFFKFDGIADGSVAGGVSAEYFEDVLGLIRLVQRLRLLKVSLCPFSLTNSSLTFRACQKNLFINLTIGTWPSPFWLMIGDSIWRGEYDVNMVAGPGSARQRWISYRDGVAFIKVVQRSPLFPLNSLMLHGKSAC